MHNIQKYDPLTRCQWFYSSTLINNLATCFANWISERNILIMDVIYLLQEIELLLFHT